MKKTTNIIKTVTVFTLFTAGLVLLFCESDSMAALLASKAAAAASLWAGSKLFNRWQDVMPAINEPES